MPLRFDLSLSPFGVHIDELTEAARRAEAAGFDGVWVYDHLSGVVSGAEWTLDPWVALTSIAAATDRVFLGPLVLNAPARHPARIALASATLQQFSGGRLLLGMGAGAGDDAHGEELGMVGMDRFPASVRRSITADSIHAVRALWANRAFSGRHFQLVAPHSFLAPDPPPPIIVGANGPRMAELAAEHADGINLHGREPELEALCESARTHSRQANFLVTVEAPLTDEWTHGAGRRRLDAIGVDRVMYRWRSAHGLDAILRAGSTLGLPRSG